VRFLPDKELYINTEACLSFLRGLGPGSPGAGGAPRRYHLYWYGPFGRKPAFALKSLLATQNLAESEVWLWLDAADGYAGYEENPFLRPLLPFVRVRRFDPAHEPKDTPTAGRPELYAGLMPVGRSNLVRFVVLYKYGGIYADMDTMFLRDLGPLLRDARFGDEFCYQWSLRPFANTAMLALREGSATAEGLLVRCRELGSCSPRDVIRFDGTSHLGLLVLPVAFFDPLWAHHDGEERYLRAPFSHFKGFFKPIRFPRRAAVRSYRDFFPGAFAYHWHNCWDVPEDTSSYFGRFDRELDTVLRDRLGSALTPRDA
jgi:hypothetical protein